MIQVKNVSYEYDDSKLALDNISFTVPKGSITALVGPNGAGKTTLISTIIGFLTPLSGETLIDGISPILDPHSAHGKIGYLPDFFGVYKSLTVHECLKFVGLANDIPEDIIEDRIDDVIHNLSLGDYLLKKAGDLSRGLTQRLAIGQAIIHDPEYIILDEPASGLDPESRIQLSELFVELKERGKTLLISSHILAELDQYSTNMVIINDGKLTDVSAIDEAKDTKRLLITLESPNPKFQEIIKKSNLITKTEKKSNNSYVVFLKTSETKNSEIMKFAIKNNIDIEEITSYKRNLQEEYLSHIKGEK